MFTAANNINTVISIINSPTNAIPNHFNILITNPASFSVLLTFSTNTDWISLSNNSSILTFNSLDSNFNKIETSVNVTDDGISYGIDNVYNSVVAVQNFKNNKEIKECNEALNYAKRKTRERKAYEKVL